MSTVIFRTIRAFGERKRHRLGPFLTLPRRRTPDFKAESGGSPDLNKTSVLRCEAAEGPFEPGGIRDLLGLAPNRGAAPGGVPTDERLDDDLRALALPPVLSGRHDATPRENPGLVSRCLSPFRRLLSPHRLGQRDGHTHAMRMAGQGGGSREEETRQWRVRPDAAGLDSPFASNDAGL